MADLTSSNVVVNRSWSTTLSNGNVLFSKACTATVTVMGTVANKIPASAFGLSSFERVSAWSKIDNTEIIPAGITTARDQILLKAPATAAPADASGSFNFIVEGY